MALGPVHQYFLQAKKNLSDIPKKRVCRRNSTSTLLIDDQVDIPLRITYQACAKVFSVESPHTYPEVKWTPALKGKNCNTLKGYCQLKGYFGIEIFETYLRRMLYDKFFFWFLQVGSNMLDEL